MARLVHVHAVVALALPAVEAFDLAIPAQVFGDRRQGGRYSFTVCAPAAGLLDNRRATTHWQYAAELEERHPAVTVDPDRLWVDEGSVLTSAGLAAGIDLCVQLVRADYGSDTAIDVARYMVVAPHRDGGQAQLLQRPVPPSAESLAQ
jgi:transcriptional regulator GlxA family with amidase domain